jgi:hypothetical protein
MESFLARRMHYNPLYPDAANERKQKIVVVALLLFVVLVYFMLLYTPTPSSDFIG